jgi:uncharacterized protein YunC (DUF1805 family)
VVEYYINHTYLDHIYIMIGYLDIDMKDNVYSKASTRTPVNNIRLVTSVDDTPAMNAGGKRMNLKETLMMPRIRKRKT